MVDLQNRRSAFSPNSLQSRVADHASTLVLSPRRAVTPFLLHNALRDAQAIVLRRDKLDLRRFPKPLYGTAGNPDGLELRHEVDGLVDTWTEPTELEIEQSDRSWTEHYARIRAALAEKNLRLAEVFDHWRDEITVEQSAVQLGISKGYVKKMRLQISAVARALRH